MTIQVLIKKILFVGLFVLFSYESFYSSKILLTSINGKIKDYISQQRSFVQYRKSRFTVD